MTFLLAHAGHWAAGLLYLLPVAAVAVLLLWERLKGRRGNPDDAQHQDPS